MMNVLHTALMILLLQTSVLQQMGSIEGSVFISGTTDPVASATVELRLVGDERLQYSVSTNDEGRFAFRNVSEGSYRVSVTNPGHVRTEYGQRSQTGRGEILRVGSGQRVTGLQIRLTSTAAVQGRVYGADGRPFVKATVEALKSTYQSGQQSFVVIQSALTNDLGEYRLFWLTPGRYYLRVSAPDWGLLGDGVRLDNSPSPLPRVSGTTGARFSSDAGALPLALGRSATVLANNRYVPIYFPNAPSPEGARELDLKAGDNLSGLDLLLSPVATRRIRGIVVDEATGQPPVTSPGYATTVQSLPRLDGGSVAIDAKGEFEIPALRVATILSARTLRRPDPLEEIAGLVTIPAGEVDIDGVRIVINSGFVVAGQIRMEGAEAGAADARLKGLRVTLQRDPQIATLRPADSGLSSETGTFTLRGVTPGDYRVDVIPILDRAPRAPAANPVAYVKSIHLGDADVLNGTLRLNGPPAEGVGLRIVIADDWGSVTGRVVDAASKPMTQATIVLVPAIEQRSRRDLFKTAAADTNGQFRFERVPLGDYKLFAWEEIEPGAWFDPAFLTRIEDQGKEIRVGARSNSEVPVLVVNQ
jgi:hypothetical protein